jgi:uncharacterized membrane protein
MIMSTDNNLSDKKNSYNNHAGTDPNRYANFQSVEETEEISKYNLKKDSKFHLPKLKVNVSKWERIIMVTAGSYLLYKALTAKNKGISQSITGGTLLLRGVSGYCPLYDAVGKIADSKSSNVNIRTSIFIDKPVNEVYDFWRKLENLPKFMSHLSSVKEVDSQKSEWTAKGPAGVGQVSWEAEILIEERGKTLSWHSLPGSTINNAGKVVFKPSGNGTLLDVTISYHAPLGAAGEKIAQFLNPYFENIVTGDIENLKTHLEQNNAGVLN